MEQAKSPTSLFADPSPHKVQLIPVLNAPGKHRHSVDPASLWDRLSHGTQLSAPPNGCLEFAAHGWHDSFATNDLLKPGSHS